MSPRTIVFFCVQAFLAHAINAQCLGAFNPALNLANSGLGLGCGALNPGVGINNAAVANGGGFTVTSTSPIAPSGVSVVSEYVIEGPVNVGGQLPLLGAVAVEGQLPTGGAAGTSYGCGNGNVGIISENGAGAVNGLGSGVNGLVSGVNGLSAGINGLGAGVGLGAPGLGAGLAAGLGSGLGINRLSCGY